MKRSLSTLALLAGLLGSASPAAAAIAVCDQNPPDGSIASQSAGHKKEIEMQIGPLGPPLCGSRFMTGAPELPLTLPLAATATLTISGPGGRTVNCQRIVTDPPPDPPPGQCNFAVVRSEFAPSGVGADTVRVAYNALLPAGANVTVEINGVRDALGATVSDRWSFRVATPARGAVGLELVFDTSVSMKLPAVEGGLIRRIDALRDASRVMYQLLNFYTQAGDLIGLVTFNTTASAFDPTPGGSNLEPADVPASGTAIRNELARLNPDGAWTSIGSGLAMANTAGLGMASTPSKNVLLFSDGEQNTAPCVQVVAKDIRLIPQLTPTPGSGCPSPDPGTPALYPAGISICPLTAGRMAAPGFALQQAIAHARCGDRNGHIRGSDDTAVVRDLETHLVQILVRMLSGDNLELALDSSGTLDAGATAVIPFLANADDLSMGILLTWPDTDLARLPLRLQAPDGTFVEAKGRTRLEGRTSLTHLRLPLRRGRGHAPLRTEGEWKLHLGGAEVPALAYHLVVVLDNSTLASEFSTPVADAATGDPIPVQVKLTQKGHPVRRATVTAAVSAPGEGLGDVLSSLPAPASLEGDGRGKGPNAGAAAKLEALAADPAATARLAERAAGTVTLRDDGSAASGDARAGDGIYSGLFHGTTEEGHYDFVFDARGRAPSNGDFQRTHRLSAFVRPKPDPSRAQVRVASRTDDAGGSLVVLEARPQDALGNLLGPGYLGSLSIDVAGGTVAELLADKLDGTYEISYRIPAGAEPRATLTVLGQTVIDQPVHLLPTRF